MYTGPHLIKSNLVFGYDTGYGVADNNTTTRFYPGENTTNVVTNRLPTTGWNTANAQGSSITRTFLTENGIPFMRFSNVTNGSDYPRVTDSTFYNSTTVTGTFSTSLEVRGTVGASLRFRIYQNGSTKITNTVTLTSDWVRYTFDNQTTSFNLNQPYFNPLTTGATYDIRNIQIESKSHTTPFVDGTRSSTQSLIDLKSTTDIDVSNVSFDSTGQPEFDGTNDEIQIASSDWNKVTEVTVEAVVLVKGTPIDGNNYHVVAQKDGAYSGGSVYGIRISGANVPFGVFSKDSTQAGTHIDTVAGTTMTTNKYYHLVYTRKVGQSVFYQNGEQKSINTSSNDVIYNNTSTFTIGQGDGRQLYGNIPVLKVHNRALTAGEVKQNYNAYKNRFDI